MTMLNFHLVAETPQPNLLVDGMKWRPLLPLEFPVRLMILVP